MTQSQRRRYLIKALLNEQEEYSNIEIPEDEVQQKNLLRSLMNVRRPKPIGEEFLRMQDEYLKIRTAEKGITDITDLAPIEKGIYLWQGDITTLRCDAIVNAANSQMLGCFCPCHGCIDNAIHTFAGIQLRLECAQIMEKQGEAEPAGSAKLTGAYSLPCKYVIHTVGPVVRGMVSPNDEKLLASCYLSCLKLADKNNIKNIAFCCISTGEFHFPNKRAAEIAVETVRSYKERTKSRIEVIFNVYKKTDFDIYRKLFNAD